MAGELRAPLLVLEDVAEGTVSIRAPLAVIEPLTSATVLNLLASFACVEPVTDAAVRNLRASFASVEAVSDSVRNLRMSLIVIESLHPVEPEGTVSTDPFPGSPGSPASLPGLAFSVHKRPRFSTIVHPAQSGVTVRSAQMQYPIWEFEFTYEFITDDRSLGQSSLQSLMGFFLSRQGGFDTFLLKDSQNDDYRVVNGVIGLADGVTTQFSFKRVLGGFSEKVGQVDTGQTITLYGSIVEPRTIPATPGPYTITTAHAATFVEDLGVTKAAVPMVKVASAPTTGQYAVNIATGVYTFAAADQNQAVVISYRYTIAPADYTVTMPNLVVFASAPAAQTISADFEFFFNCRFQEDMADFERFSDRLWQLQQVVIETVPQ